ncbi:MAG: hypothetical protein LC798_14100 [Chloroflexi bacterium]|nr:hypothetical protein [Chloroflexota bacterium]
MARVAPTVVLLGVFGVTLAIGVNARRACITSEFVSGTASAIEARPGDADR